MINRGHNRQFAESSRRPTHNRGGTKAEPAGLPNVPADQLVPGVVFDPPLATCLSTIIVHGGCGDGERTGGTLLGRRTPSMAWRITRLSMLLV